jgi:hypothetical protein
MQEYGWLHRNDVWGMLDRVSVNHRKMRLAACAIVRLLGDRITDSRARALLEGAEAHADFLLNREQLKRLRPPVAEYLRELGSAVQSDPAARQEWGLSARGFDESDEDVVERWVAERADSHPQGCVARLIQHASDPRALAPWQVAGFSDGVRRALRPQADAWLGQAPQAELLRDVFGNPFRPVVFDPSWRTEAVVGLARGMYESRDFGPMPALADALEVAGCADAAVLMHCRGPGPHVRGCWVVDLVLGKA